MKMIVTGASRNCLYVAVCAILVASYSLYSRAETTSAKSQKNSGGASVSPKAKPTSAKSKTQAPKPMTIALPEAHAGQPYNVHAYIPSTLIAGWISYVLNPAPKWLRFEESTSTFRGVPDDSTSGIYQDIKLTLTSTADPKAPPQVFIFTLPVVVGADAAFPAGGPTPPPLPAKSAADEGMGTVVVTDNATNPATIPTPRVELTGDLTTATSAITGRIDPRTLATPPAAAPTPAAGATSPAPSTPASYPLLSVEVTDPVTGARSLLPLQQPGSKAGAQPGNPSTALPINADGSFSIPLPAPLTPKQRIRLIAVAPMGYAFGPFREPDDPDLDHIGERLAVDAGLVGVASIPLPAISLIGQLSAGQSAISGTVAPNTMPVSPTAPVAADAIAGTPKSTGNLASLAVEVADPLTKLVTRTPLLVSGTPGSIGNLVPVSADGTFSLQLKTPLTSGQRVRIVAIPPPGYVFNKKEGTACNVGAPPWLKNDPSLVGEAECVVQPDRAGEELSVYSALPLVQPTISSKLGLNVTGISGIATPSTTGPTGTTVLIGVERYPLGDPCRRTPPDKVLTSDDLELRTNCRQAGAAPKQLADLTVAASGSSPATSASTVQTQANGSFSLTLATPLSEEEGLRIAQILPPGTTFPDKKQALDYAYSPLITVPSVADWGRAHADFVAGLLVTNSSQIGSTDTGTFTQAHQFVDLTVEKGWMLPGCYLPGNDGGCLRRVFDSGPKADEWPKKLKSEWKDKNKKAMKESLDPVYESQQQNWWVRHHPGISSSFEGRMTAIQVTSVGGASTTTSGTTSSTTSSASTLLTGNFLTTAQTARFGASTYFPTLLQRWNWHGTPNALFIAPLAKVGFDSVTGATTINVPAGTPGASSGGTVTLEPLFNFWGFGARVGHFQLSKSENKSPETDSYFDVTYGPYSSLQSYICKRTPADKVIMTTTNTSATPPTSTSTIYIPATGYPVITGYSGSSCATDYPSYYAATVPAGLTYPIPANSPAGANPAITYLDTMTDSYQPYDSRKRLYRLDFEGLLKIPMTPLYVGFNANLAQKTLGATNLDHGYAAPDNLSIFFGTKFDIGNLLARLGITPF